MKRSLKAGLLLELGQFVNFGPAYLLFTFLKVQSCVFLATVRIQTQAFHERLSTDEFGIVPTKLRSRYGHGGGDVAKFIKGVVPGEGW